MGDRQGQGTREFCQWGSSELRTAVCYSCRLLLVGGWVGSCGGQKAGRETFWMITEWNSRKSSSSSSVAMKFIVHEGGLVEEWEWVGRWGLKELKGREMEWYCVSLERE